MSWLNDKHVKNWFENLKSDRTISNYKERFPRFIEWCKKTPTEIIKSRLEHLTTQDLEKRRYWEQQLIKFTRYSESLTDKEGKRTLSTWSIKGFQTCVQSFFAHNGVKLAFARKELDVEPSEREKVVKEWIPDNEEVRVLYRACKSARDRSVLLTLYQSGFSEVDVSNMRIEDFDFYDKNGKWQLKPFEDVYHARKREKTNILQQTCISRECIEDIRIMLQNRGFPKSGYLFVSQKGEQFTPRFINDTLKTLVKRNFKDRASLWKTKNLRDAFMNALDRAKLGERVFDSLVGHKKRGAKHHYGVTEQTIKEGYNSAFKYLAINGVGSSTRKIEQIEQQTAMMQNTINNLEKQVKDQNKTIHELQKLIREVLIKEGKIKPK